MKRKICVITGSRAEYGILKLLMQEIRKDKGLRLQLIVTGAHLSPEFGLTYKCINEDGFHIDDKVEIILSSDTPVAVSKSMGLAMIGFAESYARLKPGMVVIFGDRFEIFSAATAALIAGLPIAHISGGEVTEGAFDEAIRHSITKMSHLHFVSNREYKRRVVQLGEDPEKVFNLGSLAVDCIKKTKLLPKKILEERLTFKFNKRNLLVTFHPATLEGNNTKKQFKVLLDALDELKDCTIIFTKVNADTYGRVINTMIDGYVSKNRHKSVSFMSMGQLNYLSTLKYVDAVIGNSSSGISEAPAFKIGTINIGDRQKGRLKAKSIIDCRPAREDIRKAIKKLYSKSFQKSLKEVVNPYGDGNAAKGIKDVLKSYNLNGILKKAFYDIKFNY